MKTAFTLIELLVVVLIIGILSAIALPQYRVAVAKARVATMLNVASSIAQAQEAYYLANNEYATDLSFLDIGVPSQCTAIEGSEGKYYSCQTYFTFGIDPEGSINLNYCPGHNLSWSDCGTYWDFHIPFRLLHWSDSTNAGARLCVVKNNSKLGKAVCSSIGGLECRGC